MICAVLAAGGLFNVRKDTFQLKLRSLMGLREHCPLVSCC